MALAAKNSSRQVELDSHQLDLLSGIIPLDVKFEVERFRKGVEESFDVTLRLPFKTKEDAMTWKQKLEDKSLATFRTALVPAISGAKVIFKTIYECQHGDRGKGKGERSKKTGCQAMMSITIKRLVQFSKSTDKFLPEYPGKVRLFWCHNHSISTASALKHRDVHPEVRMKFIELFYNGHSPGTALAAYRTAKKLELGDSFPQAAVDRAFFPDIKYIHRLFTQLKKQCGPQPGTKDLPSSTEHSKNLDGVPSVREHTHKLEAVQSLSEHSHNLGGVSSLSEHFQKVEDIQSLNKNSGKLEESPSLSKHSQKLEGNVSSLNEHSQKLEGAQCSSDHSQNLEDIPTPLKYTVIVADGIEAVEWLENLQRESSSSEVVLFENIAKSNYHETSLLEDTMITTKNDYNVPTVTESQVSSTDIEKAAAQWTSMHTNILTMLKKNPEVMAPCITSCCKTFNNMSSQDAVVSALHSFGKCNGVLSKNKSRQSKRLRTTRSKTKYPYGRTGLTNKDN